MAFDRIPSRRPLVLGRRGAVATSHPLATLAGLDALRAGGTAADACVAAAAMLNVVEPMSTGIGGDAFALYWSAGQRKLSSLNGSGRAPSGATLASYRERGWRRVPMTGAAPITVPGSARAWEDLLAAHGRLGLARALAPAIDRAERGFEVTETVAANWAATEAKLAKEAEAARVYLPSGRAPRLGETVRFPELAKTFRGVAEGGAAAFYEGEFAGRLLEEMRARGASWTAADLAGHRSTWDEPISAGYRGHRVFECPPNGQGLAALSALSILDGLRLEGARLDADGLHTQIEAMKLGFADAHRYVADPAFGAVPVSELLDARYVAERRALVDPARAAEHLAAGAVAAGRDTVYLCAVDGEGNACSFINSLYYGFGSAVVVPGTGVCLQNRGAGFSLDPDHPNHIAPGKRPFHTIIPAMLFGPGPLERGPLAAFGVMGGPMQPQGHLQVACNLIDFGLDPQQALDAPRFRVLVNADEGEASGRPDYEVMLESGLSWAADDLARRGHHLVPGSDARFGGFGGGQIIRIDPETGVRAAGSDPRKDGIALAE
jgi:gamma-glutamyltranspeptidase/glutathione hydrolase